MRILFLLTSILFFNSAFAEEDSPDLEKQYVLIDGPAIEEADEKLIGELRKTVMSIILKDPNYTILLNKDINLKKSRLQALRVVINGAFKANEDKKKSYYDLEMILFNEKNGKQIRDLYEVRVAERHLFYRTRIMVYELLYGEAYLDKLDKKERSKEKKRRENRNKTPRPKFDKTSQKQGAQGKPGDPIEGAEGLDKDSKDKKKKKKEEVADNKNKKRKKKSKVSIANFSSPDLDLRKENRRGGPEKGPFKAYYDFSYGVGYVRETLNSKAKVQISETTTQFEVDNNLSLLQVNVRGNARLAPKDTMGLSLQAKLSRIMGQTDFDVSAPMSLDFFIFKGFEKFPINFQFGFKYETHSFANLGFTSSGIQPWQNKSIWLNYGANIKVPIKNYWFLVGAESGQIFSGSTNHQTKNKVTPLEGSRLELFVRSKISGNFSLEVRKSTVSVTSLGSRNLENEQDQTVLSLIYN